MIREGPVDLSCDPVPAGLDPLMVCAQRCCGNPDCTFWQYCDPSLSCLPASPAWGCHNGYDACPVKEPATNWAAMARSAPPPPVGEPP